MAANPQQGRPTTHYPGTLRFAMWHTKGASVTSTLDTTQLPASSGEVINGRGEKEDESERKGPRNA